MRNPFKMRWRHPDYFNAMLAWQQNQEQASHMQMVPYVPQPWDEEKGYAPPAVNVSRRDSLVPAHPTQRKRKRREHGAPAWGTGDTDAHLVVAGGAIGVRAARTRQRVRAKRQKLGTSRRRAGGQSKWYSGKKRMLQKSWWQVKGKGSKGRSFYK